MTYDSACLHLMAEEILAEPSRSRQPHAHQVMLPHHPLYLQEGNICKEEGSSCQSVGGARAAPQHCLLSWGKELASACKQEPVSRTGQQNAAWKPLRLSGKLSSSLVPQDRDCLLYYSLSVPLFGRRNLLPHSSRGCLSTHGVSAGTRPEEKT